MSFITLPHFGALDASSLEEYYDVAINFNSKEIQIDLNFDNKIIDPQRLETVKSFIENIRIYDINNKGYIQKDYDDASADTVQPYLQQQLEELGNNELAALIDAGTKPVDQEKQLLKKLQLVRVGIYPDSTDIFAVFDYSLGKEITDELIVINTDENGNLEYMTIES